MSELDKEFEEAVKEINAKIKEASSALKELAVLCDKANVDSLVISEATYEYLGKTKTEQLAKKLELIKGISDLEKAIDANGWSTSSSHC
jgi:hypothetical protein